MKFSDYNEGKQHGTAEFPFEYYYIEPDNPQYIMKPHWHKEFELIRILSGGFNIHLGNMGYYLSKGDIMLIECGILHRGEPENCIYECLVFDLNMLRRRQNDKVNLLIAPIINGNNSINCIIPERGDNVYNSAISLFSTASKKDEFYEIEIQSIILHLFFELYKKGYISGISKNPQNLKKNQTVIRLLDWIEENYTENITLSTLSEISNLSEKYICRIFREYTSKTPVSYINELRIEVACHEMSANSKSVTEAAFSCGFNDLSYFSKLFKRYKGVNPKQFKKDSFKNKNYL